MFDFIKNWTKRIIEATDKLETDLNNNSDKTNFDMIDYDFYEKGYERGLIAGKICGIKIAVELLNEQLKSEPN